LHLWYNILHNGLKKDAIMKWTGRGQGLSGSGVLMQWDNECEDRC